MLSERQENVYLLYFWSKLRLRVKTEKELYIRADRLGSTLNIFGLVKIEIE